jgi:hypothetical protein
MHNSCHSSFLFCRSLSCLGHVCSLADFSASRHVCSVPQLVYCLFAADSTIPRKCPAYSSIFCTSSCVCLQKQQCCVLKSLSLRACAEFVHVFLCHTFLQSTFLLSTFLHSAIIQITSSQSTSRKSTFIQVLLSKHFQLPYFQPLPSAADVSAITIRFHYFHQHSA